MVDKYEVTVGPTTLCEVVLRMLQLAMATVMAKAAATAANNLQILHLLPEFVNVTLDIAPPVNPSDVLDVVPNLFLCTELISVSCLVISNLLMAR